MEIIQLFGRGERLKGRDFCLKRSGALHGIEHPNLLRNLGRGKGIGFFETRGFYPDFILWIKEGAKQRLIFVAPHGMMLEPGGIRSEKVGLLFQEREGDYDYIALVLG